MRGGGGYGGIRPDVHVRSNGWNQDYICGMSTKVYQKNYSGWSIALFCMVYGNTNQKINSRCMTHINTLLKK